MDLNIERVKEQAKKEIQEEDFRAAIDKEKERIRTHVSFFQKVFPWRIVVIRKGGSK